MAEADDSAQRRAKRADAPEGDAAGPENGQRRSLASDRQGLIDLFSVWEVMMRKSEKATARDAAGLQAQLAEAWSQQANRSGETYGRLFAAMRDEMTNFVQRRVDANMTAVREWSECRSFNDALALQQRWMQCAVEQYVDQGTRIMETCRLAAADLAEAAQPAAEAEKPATERKPAQRHAEQHLKQAA